MKCESWKKKKTKKKKACLLSHPPSILLISHPSLKSGIYTFQHSPSQQPHNRNSRSPNLEICICIHCNRQTCIPLYLSLSSLSPFLPPLAPSTAPPTPSNTSSTSLSTLLPPSPFTPSPPSPLPTHPSAPFFPPPPPPLFHPRSQSPISTNSCTPARLNTLS